MYYSRDERRHSVDRLATELFAEHRARLMSIARRHSRCEADAQDGLQEAFAAFITQFDPSRGAPPLAWLTLTLKRTCWRLKASRCVAVEPLALAEMVPGEAGDPAVGVGEREEVHRRLAALKADERRAIVLHAAGYTYGEIGEGRGWTQTKVNRCLYEGRRALRASR